MLIELGFVNKDSTLYKVAAKAKNYEATKILYDYGCGINEYLFELAVLNKDKNLIETCMKDAMFNCLQKPIITYQTLKYALKQGNVKFFKELYPRSKIFSLDMEKLVDRIVKYKITKLFDYFVGINWLHKYYWSCAFKYNNEEAIKFCKNKGLTFSCSVLKDAFDAGYFEIIDSFFERAKITGSCSIQIAIKYHRLDVVKRLVELGAKLNVWFVQEAVEASNLEFIEYFEELRKNNENNSVFETIDHDKVDVYSSFYDKINRGEFGDKERQILKILMVNSYSRRLRHECARNSKPEKLDINMMRIANEVKEDFHINMCKHCHRVFGLIKRQERNPIE